MNKLKRIPLRVRDIINLMSEWSESMVSRFSAAMRARRKQLDMSVQDVANRTAELGHPISRSALSGLENDRNKDRLSLPDALVIAECLRVPMFSLLFPQQPDGEVELVPGLTFPSETAINIIKGNVMPKMSEDKVQNGSDGELSERNKEIESGYEFSTLVSLFSALKRDVPIADLSRLKVEAEKGDELAKYQLRSYELSLQLLRAHADSIRARGGVVNEDWFPDEKSRDE